ncbi:MAG: hypothetical protein IPN77_30775 [Sandaracinaceae bacterium]|nr:hypothetical protein [Sandaracinaceae bacterium]
MLFTAPIGGVNEVGCAIALDGSLPTSTEWSPAATWVGLHHGEAFLHPDGETGELRECVETPGLSALRGHVFDAFGNLYAISRDGYLLTLPRARVGELTVLAVPLACYLLYGLAADADGRLLMSGFSCDQVTLARPGGAHLPAPSRPRPACAAWAITAGGAWVAYTTGARPDWRLDLLRVMQTVDLGVPIETLGAAADAAGRIWLVSSQESFSGVARASQR